MGKHPDDTIMHASVASKKLAAVLDEKARFNADEILKDIKTALTHAIAVGNRIIEVPISISIETGIDYAVKELIRHGYENVFVNTYEDENTISFTIPMEKL